MRTQIAVLIASAVFLLAGCASPPTQYVLATKLATYDIQASLDRPATIDNTMSAFEQEATEATEETRFSVSSVSSCSDQPRRTAGMLALGELRLSSSSRGLPAVPRGSLLVEQNSWRNSPHGAPIGADL